MNTYTKRRQNLQPGFTLVELMVVIAIVALLLTLLLPVMGTARETTRRTLCMQNVKLLGLSCMVYANDNQNVAMDAGGYPVMPVGADWNSYGRWSVDPYQRKRLYYDYGMSDYKTWFCPSSGANAPFPLRSTFYNPRFISFDRTYQSWPDSDNHWAITPYSYFAGPSRYTKYTIGGTQQYMLKYDTVTSPSLRIVWADGLNGPTTQWIGSSATLLMPGNTHWFSGEARNGPDGGNYVMTDGHAEWRPYNYGVNVIDTGPSANWTHYVFQYYSYK